MTRDPDRHLRRQLADEAYQWRKQAMSQNRSHLHAVADPAADPSPGRPIVVGFDGTAGALPALRWAVDEARDRRVPLVIVRAWQTDEQLAEKGLLGPQEQLEELAQATLPEWARDQDGVSVLVASRAAGQAIVERSSEAAMIVVGRRRLGPLQRAWLGSTSAYVMQHATCPVVVVPETSAAEGHLADAPDTSA